MMQSDSGIDSHAEIEPIAMLSQPKAHDDCFSNVYIPTSVYSSPGLRDFKKVATIRASTYFTITMY
jgi:hypothetical protein